VSAAKRKKWCDVPKNLEGLMLDTEHVCTFHIWQHFIDFSAYKFSVGGLCNLDLAGPLNGQPLQLTVYDTKVCLFTTACNMMRAVAFCVRWPQRHTRAIACPLTAFVLICI
jgi:hypothetical protein